MLDVVEVLVTADGPLVLHQLSEPDHGHSRRAAKSRDTLSLLWSNQKSTSGEPRMAVVDHSLAAHQQVSYAMLLEQRDEDLDVGREVVGSHLSRSDSRTSGASSP